MRKRGHAGRRIVAAVVLALTAAACGAEGSGDGTALDGATVEAGNAADDVSAALRDNGLTSLASALESIEPGWLDAADDITLLAPDDEAFFALDADELAALFADPAALEALVRNHVVAGRHDGPSLAGTRELTTDLGSVLDVATDEGGLRLGDATVLTEDVDAAGTLVHVIDRVLVP